MSSELVLHVCYDPRHLVSRERLLMRMGYQIVTVLGMDGLLAQSHLSKYRLVIIGDSATLEERRAAVHWIKQQSRTTSVIALCKSDEKIPEADYQALTEVPGGWIDSVANYLRRDKTVRPPILR